MIKAILVPATGSNSDASVFASALAVARKFAGHIDFLHVRVDATAMAATMASDGGGAVMISGLVDRIIGCRPPSSSALPTPPAASRARAYAPTQCPSRSSVSAPSPSCRTWPASRDRHSA